MRRDPDKPLFDWSEVLVTADGGCVVRLPHTADRLDVGLAIMRTEMGWDWSPSPGEVTTEAAWGRLLTLREQWDLHREMVEDPDLPADPPEGWWPHEGIPSWRGCPAGQGEEIWTCVPTKEDRER